MALYEFLYKVFYPKVFYGSDEEFERLINEKSKKFKDVYVFSYKKGFHFSKNVHLIKSKVTAKRLFKLNSKNLYVYDLNYSTFYKSFPTNYIINRITLKQFINTLLKYEHISLKSHKNTKSIIKYK